MFTSKPSRPMHLSCYKWLLFIAGCSVVTPSGIAFAQRSNVFLGYQAGLNNIAGTQNILLGYQAGMNSTGPANTYIGYRAGASTTTGQFNTFIGSQAGAATVSGSGNFFMGTNAGSGNVDGGANIFVGDNSGGSATYSARNVFIGVNSGSGNTGNGIDNTLIGYGANMGIGNIFNATAIGKEAVVSRSNSLVLGNSSVNVGIGNSAPNAKLEITQGASGNSGLRFTNLTSGNGATVLNQTKFLTVNSQGDVILGSTNSSAREGMIESLWERNGRYLQSTQDDAVIIGTGVKKTPSDYNLFVSRGILTEKIKVAIKNTTDWSDKVFGPTYRLQSLPEVERYIQTHQHLPGLPSAEEVVKQGIDVGKMDAKLLEKIEELTLYIITQQKEIASLRQQVSDLAKAVKQ